MSHHSPSTPAPGKETTTPGTILGSKYIYNVTEEAAKEVASNLRDEDYREIYEGHGIKPEVIIPICAQNGFCVHFKSPSGKTAGLAGIQKGGLIWMVTTPVIYEHPMMFARECKRFINSREEPLLWNIIDKRNTVHLKLLRFLGFKFLREIIHGPNQLPFIEFCHVCTSSGSVANNTTSSVGDIRLYGRKRKSQTP